MSTSHTYQTNVIWSGARYGAAESYTGYSREFTISADQKQNLVCSSDPMFRGDPSLYNPEDLFISTISSCHLLWYLHLCVDAGVKVISYSDNPNAKMEIDADGGGRFVVVTLHPDVVIADASHIALAESLHEKAHQKCFIANSVNFPVLCVAKTRVKAV